jgi:signal transduction histidine kinase
VHAREAEAASRGLAIGTAVTATPVRGDARLLERLVANLVDNAVRHNIPDGSVQVATRTVGGRATVSVLNTGPVIPPDQVDRLFQPFHRLRSRRTSHGHGLGLSIVHAIATAHGATVTAHALPQGGLAIDVTFPPPGQVAAHPARRGVASGA